MRGFVNTLRGVSAETKSKWARRAGVGLVGTGFALGSTVSANDPQAHPLHVHWSHDGMLDCYDSASVRRGHQVYTQLCASCHSMNGLAYRNLVDVCYTEAEVKELAAEIEVTDGPNDEGEMFQRPGKLSDKFPLPYPNEEAARAANGGAYPPDLTLMTKARHDGQNYVFSLLLGYKEAPAGVEIREGLHYNPYFPGGAIAMAKQLHAGVVDYDDGTEATESQMAKDITTFLAWAAEPEMDQRKKMGVKLITGLVVASGFFLFYKNYRWSVVKSRRVEYKMVN